jgi:ABC-type multidrug transport system ATPase subunit
MADDEFPVLFEVSTERSHPLGDRQTVAFGGQGRADVAVDGVSGDELLFQLEADEGQWFLVPRASATPVSVNQVPARGRVPLTHLAIIQATPHIFVFIERDDPTVATAFMVNQWLVGRMLEATAKRRAEKKARRDRDVGDEVTMRATIRIVDGRPQELDDMAPPLAMPGEIDLPGMEMLIGRDRSRVDICLPDVRVSRVHASIKRGDRTATITDLKSANGTFVDGQRVIQPTPVKEGNRIQIGPYRLVFTGRALFPLSHDKNVELVAQNLVRRVPDREHRGQMKTILDDVSLAIRPREFACIIGPSGSGKSTLLSALSGRYQADEGTVLLNGEDLYENFDSLKQNLAVVPQRDVLHDVLTLNRALWYTAKLRLPADMSRQDIDERIAEMLKSVHLTEQRRNPIRRLSGGQTKRASWVNEAICNPSLIFLDEVTSGLDQQTDAEMMQLFRQMADDGKTIVCVTHSVTYVEENCDLLVILAPGGVLAFVGPPEAAFEYFYIPRLGDVYERLSLRPPHEWQERFRKNPLYEQYVQRRLPQPTSEAVKRTELPKKRQADGLLVFWRQFSLLTRRYMAIQWADKRPLIMMLGQSLFIAALLVWLFGNIAKLDDVPEAKRMANLYYGYYDTGWDDLVDEEKQPFLDEAEEAKRADFSSKVLFLLCISCMWFGCNNAAKEIVKERTIYGKERDVGLHVVSYYGSKLALLGVLSVVQATVLYWIVRYFTCLGGEAPQQWLLLSLSSLTGVAMGLAISAIANSTDLAATIVPISLIPQIIFAGLIAPLSGWARGFAQIFISTYWSFQGLLGRLDDPLPERLRDTGYLDLGSEFSLAIVCSVLVAHVLVFAITAILALYIRDAK